MLRTQRDGRMPCNGTTRVGILSDAAGTLAYIVLTPRPGEAFTEFYILGPGSNASATRSGSTSPRMGPSSWASRTVSTPT